MFFFGITGDGYNGIMKPFCVRWCKSVLNFCKVNLAWVKVGNKFGYAGIIRNHLGTFISGFADWAMTEDNHTVVLMSVMSGIKLCKKLIIYNIVFEASSPLVNIINTGGNDLIGVSNLFYVRRRIFEELISFSYSISVINMEVNAVAQAVAVLGTMLKHYKELNRDQLLVYVQGLLNLDQIGFPYVYH
ncbi:hypothetical protein KFK09_019582 [Dendrobium nobile]|nr:hypothetical protein KFK09_019582 [Dendrobium nobile]